MITKELLEWVEKQNIKLDNKFDKNFSTDAEKIFAQMAKITEEVGELSSEVLEQAGLQRERNGAFIKNNEIAHECVDVLLTTLLLADRLGVDINRALEEKLVKIDNRFASN